MKRDDPTLLMIVENHLDELERDNPRAMLTVLEMFGDGDSFWAQRLRLRIALMEFKAELYKVFLPILNWLAKVIR